ncbi:MAG: anaerobic ribonucleoside-triphosphate reductase [Salinivirgaceae bacterium]|nr:anaerobic ribonucleoside-triphosphate reductase [Salinivirgaceae bacterium]MDY0281285.1 anaerobic ribonucleoside-triphosphate reductase [Salinivirgaceae bacterium]
MERVLFEQESFELVKSDLLYRKQREHHQCPTCQADCEVYSRIVGYMRPINQWNNGKRQEFKDRKLFHLNNVALRQN